MKKVLNLLVLATLLLSSSLGFSQEDKPKKNLMPFFAGGANFGGTVSSNNFLYSSGISAQIGMLHQLTDQVQIGVGVGIVNFDNDYFYPVFFRVDAAIFKNPNAKLLLQSGFSWAENRSDVSLSSVDLDGGYFIETGRLWSFDLGENVNLFTSMSFRYQFAHLEYSFENAHSESRVDYMSVNIRGGILLK
ncbi:MAG: hypothetical protein ACI84C_001055 [Flavobacteriales bacterium]